MGTVSVANAWWMNSGDALQIALRHTGELVKEAAEKDNGSFSLHCLLKGPDKKRKKICSENRHALNTTGSGTVCKPPLPPKKSYGPVAAAKVFFSCTAEMKSWSSQFTVYIAL